MEEWKEYKLGDLYEVHNGLSKGSKFFGSGYPFLSFKTVFKNYFLPTNLPDLVQSNEKEQKGYDIKRGDVFVTRTSETSEELGMSSVALKDYPLATYNGFTKRLRPKDNSIVYPEFIGYYLRSSKFRAFFYGLASSMSTRASLANGDLLGLKVFLPSIETQEKIAMLLKSLDDKIAVNKKICENLEAQAQALFKHWFVDFAPFKDGKFVESELGLIPEGWTLIPFSQILTPSNEKVGKVGVPEFSVTNTGIHPRSDTFNKSLSKDSSKNKLLRKNNLVFGMSRDILNWGIMKEEEGGVSSAYHIYIVDTEQVNATYLEEFIKYNIKYFHDLIKPASREGQGHDKNALYNKYVYVPTKNIIDEFMKIYVMLKESILSYNQESLRLSTLRDTLLPKLMSGQIKI